MGTIDKVLKRLIYEYTEGGAATEARNASLEDAKIWPLSMHGPTIEDMILEIPRCNDSRTSKIREGIPNSHIV